MPNHDDEFYYLNQPSFSLKEMKKIGNPTDIAEICMPNHDDEFYDLNQPSFSLKEMKKIGRLAWFSRSERFCDDETHS